MSVFFPRFTFRNSKIPIQLWRPQKISSSNIKKKTIQIQLWRPKISQNKNQTETSWKMKTIPGPFPLQFLDMSSLFSVHQSTLPRWRLASDASGCQDPMVSSQIHVHPVGKKTSDTHQIELANFIMWSPISRQVSPLNLMNFRWVSMRIATLHWSFRLLT